MERDTFEFDGGSVRLTDLGAALVAAVKMIGTLLAAASAAAFGMLMAIVIALYVAGFHPLGF